MLKEEIMQFIIVPQSTVVQALEKIEVNTKGILFVVNQKDKLIGTLTDGDIRRWLIKTGELEGTVEKVMNRKPKFITIAEIVDVESFMDEHLITAVPLLDSNGVIKNIFFKKKSRTQIKERTALEDVYIVIMAGGKGTRLYPYTKILPKPLIPIGEIPIMERIIMRFQEFGAKKFYATVNYKKNMIKSYFSEIGYKNKICYIEEQRQLGTAGSLSLIEVEFNKPFIVTNCDILIQADYEEIYKYHIESKNELTMVTALKRIVIPYGVVHSKENGLIESMEEKPKLSYLINTGMYILNPELLHEIPKDTIFHMTDLVNRLLEADRKVGMYPISEDSFLDMGEFEEMARMEEKLSLMSK